MWRSMRIAGQRMGSFCWMRWRHVACRTVGVCVLFGVPRSTVYFIARVKDDVKARAYCRNLKTRQGAPFGRIRLEAQARYGPLDVMLDDVQDPSFCASVWHSRYGGLEGTVTRLARELQATELAGRVGRGEMTYAQGERMSTFLDLERLGLAEMYYPRSVHMARKREARTLGLASNEMGLRGMEVDVEYLLAPYRKAFGGTQLAGDAALALASGTPPPGVASEVAERLPGI
jgi:hypothetical protein